MSAHLTDRLTAAFLGHADHVDRALFGEARDEIVRLRALERQTFRDERANSERAEAAERAALLERDRLRDALPDLSLVITWLQNGCSPAAAAQELEIYKTRIHAALGDKP